MNRQRLTILGYELDSACMMGAHEKTLVFVHGIGVAGNYFMPLAERLGAFYNVIVLDLPGYGKTPKPDHALSIPELATVLAGVLDYYKLSRPVLIGQSMGCQTVAYLLCHEPGRAAQAVLISPSTNKNERTVPMQALRLLQDVFHETFRMDIVTFTDYVRMGLVRFLATSRSMVADHIEDNVAEVTIPVLFIRGESDKIVPQDWIDYLVSVTPDARLCVIPRAPHNLHYTLAETVGANIRQFVA